MNIHPRLRLPPLLLGVAAGLAQAAGLAGFSIVEQSLHSQIDAPRFEAVRDEAALRALWRAHGAAAPPPAVDFKKEMLVAAFAGQKPTGGYQLNLVGVKQRRGRVEVALSLTQPGPDCIVERTATQPYVLARLARSDRPAEFRLAARTFSCVTGKPL